MKRLAACAIGVGVCVLGTLSSSIAAVATIPPEQPTDTAAVDPTGTTSPDTATTETTLPVVGVGESGAATPVPIAGPSAPLVQIPNGCPVPPVASVVFVGKMVAKVTDTARFRVEQIRAGNADGYIVGDLIDIHYDNETQYLTTSHRYLVGAVPFGTSLALSSKVRPSHPLFGGNAVIGLTEKNLECPTIEDPVRTLNLDGTEIDNSLLQGLTSERTKIALAFIGPAAIAFAIVFGLVLIRWLFTLIFITVRQAADPQPIRRHPRDRRHHPRPT